MRPKMSSTVPNMDELPTFEELHTTILSMQRVDAPGEAGIPAELWKFGGVALVNCL